MSYEAARYECKRCGAKFLTQKALNGHGFVHRDEGAARVVNGP